MRANVKLLCLASCLVAGTAIGAMHDSGPFARRQALLQKSTTVEKQLKRASRPAKAQEVYEYRDTVADVPYIETFDKPFRLNYFTLIDANADDTKWTWGTTSRGGNPCASYPYNSKNNADDWLISPDVRLEAGHHYLVSFDAACQGSSFHEKVEAKWGQGKTVEAMTNDLVAETEIVSWNSVTLSKEISIKTSGVYNFGIHAVSDKDKGHLYIDNLKVEELALSAAPAAATDLTVTPDPHGKQSATITCTLPTTDIDGNALTSLDYVTIYNSSRLIKKIDNPTPGSVVTAVDSKAAHAKNMYIVTAYAGGVKGTEASVVQFVGLDVPNYPDNVIAADLTTQVKLSWDKVSPVGLYGGVVDPDNTDYIVYNVTDEGALGDEIATVSTTSYTFDYNTTTGEQKLVQWGIQSSNSLAKSTAVGVSMMTGESYATPFKDSFGDDDHMWWLDMDDDSDGWSITSGVDADGDKASATAAVDGGHYTSLMSGKVALSTLNNPMLRFKYRMVGTEGTKLTLCTLLPSGLTEELTTVSCSEGDKKWKTINASLAKYKDQPYVIIGFKAHADADSKGGNLWVDDMTIGERCTKDLTVSISPNTGDVRKGRAISGTVRVEKLGLDENAEDFTVKLYKNSTLVETLNGQIAASEDEWTKTFSINTNARDNDLCALKAVVELAGDEVTTNNEAQAQINFRTRELPAPQNVTVSGTTITWAAPTVKSKTMVDGFEDYNTWTNCFGDWTVVNANHGLASGLIHNTPYPNQGTAVGMQIFNFDEVVNALTTSNQYVKAHGGVQFVGSPLVTDDDANFIEVNNWLISPHLSGRAQTITFYANNLRSATDQLTNTYDNYPERVQVLASTTGQSVSDFTPVADAWWVNNGSWTSYSFNLPEGTKYFAIHHMSDAQHAVLLFIDDVAFESSVGQPVAYNVYDGEQFVGKTDAATTSYVIESAASTGSHNYYVSAVYDENDESDAICANTASGIEAVSSDAQTGSDAVYSIGGVRYDKMPAAHGIYIKNGKKIVRK